MRTDPAATDGSLEIDDGTMCSVLVPQTTKHQKRAFNNTQKRQLNSVIQRRMKTSEGLPRKHELVCVIAVMLLQTATAFLPQQLPTSLPQNNKNGIVILKSSEDSNAPPEKAEKKEPIILSPNPEAADPKYSVRGAIGQGDFVISREGGPTKEELANENILRIVLSESADLEVNTLMWKCLGYRFDPEKEEWNNSECFPNWRENYPTPPDLIGMQRIYSPDIDKPSLRANQALVRSVPVDNKQSLKEHMKPLGWKGFQVRT
jgi:hypothetical protein